MSDSDVQGIEPTPQPRKGNQTLIIILLCVVTLLLAGLAVMFFYQHKQNLQFQRMQAATVYFDKLEQEEKALAEQERLKAEQEKLLLALEEAKKEAERAVAAREEEKAAAARAEAARQAAAQQSTYNPCEHVYEGKVFPVTTASLFGDITVDWTVVGYSSSSGRASVRNNDHGNTQEIYCSQIPN